MIKTLNIDKDYKEIFALSQFAFQYQLTEEELLKKKEEAWRHIIWGHMDGNKIASKLHLIPLSVYIGGTKKISMGGISSVATWPEYRRGGMVKELLHHALKYMKDHGQVVSYLHPFSVPFYRKYGWELVFTEKSFTIPIDKLKKNWSTKGIVRTKPFDYQTINAIYDTFAKNYSGMLVRDEKWWEQRVMKDKAHLSIAYDNSEQPVGYIHFKVKENVFYVIDWAYTTINGLNLILNFIANHDSMVKEVKMTVAENDLLPLLIDEPRFEQKLEPYFMARIVDVHKLLISYPVDESVKSSVTIHVNDTFLPENTRSYQLVAEDGHLKVTVIPYQQGKSGVRCSIQQLTSMLFGYTSPLDLHKIGLVSGKVEDVMKLKALIPDQKTYFPDFF